MARRTKVSGYGYRRPLYIEVRGGRRKAPFMERVRLFFRRLTVAALSLVIIACSYFITFTIGQMTVPQTDQDIFPVVHAELEEVWSRPPVLARIAKAESLDSHFCTETHVRAKLCAKAQLGKVLVRTNGNGTKDVGRYQVNTYYWGEKARELGFDVYDEEGNERMARWIYENHGTEPWVHSKKNWK